MAKRFDHDYLDASENAFLRRELEHVQTRSYDILFPDEKGRLLVPVDHGVHTGAEIVTFNTLEGVGQSQIGGGYAGEGPRVDVLITDQSQRIVPIRNSYGYSIQEVRNSMMANRSLPQLRANTARQVIEQDINQLLLVGSTEESIAGLFNLSGITTVTIALGALGSKLWGQKTSDEIAADLFDMEEGVFNATKENTLLLPDTLVLPTTAYNLASRKRMGDGSNMTILKYFLENAKFIKNVEWSFELETLGAGSTRRMACYRKNEIVLKAIIPQEFESLPPQQRDFETIINCHARYGGIELHYPKAVAYGDSF